MKNEFIKKTEDCRAAGCINCSACAGMNSRKNEDLLTETRTGSDLYDKEVEAYYFYFLRNKAS